MPPEHSDPLPLTVVKSESRAVERSAPAIADMMKDVIRGGVTKENVEAMTQLVKLYEHMQDRDREAEFAQAFNALQSEMKKVKAMKPVPDRHGVTKYKFAPYEEIMDQVKPLLEKHHFTLSFSSDFKEGRIYKICTLQHISGHSKETRFGCNIGSGPPNASAAQADGAASTYAKRFALCDALNIIIESDHDANVEGTAISPEKARELRERLKNVHGTEDAFLTFAKAASFEEIASAKLEMLEDFLAKKERIYMQKLGAK